MTTTIEYALMAGAAYISNRVKINRIPAPTVWLENIDKRTSGNPSGFEATIKGNEKKSKGSASHFFLNNYATSPTH